MLTKDDMSQLLASLVTRVDYPDGGPSYWRVSTARFPGLKSELKRKGFIQLSRCHWERQIDTPFERDLPGDEN